MIRLRKARRADLQMIEAIYGRAARANAPAGEDCAGVFEEKATQAMPAPRN